MALTMFCSRSYFQNRTNPISTAKVQPMAAPLLSTSSPVIDDTLSEISFSVVGPEESPVAETSPPVDVELQSIYQAAYNISRWSFHAPALEPAATNMNRSISEDSVQTQEDVILEEPDLQFDDPFTDVNICAADETVAGPSGSHEHEGFSAWRTHIVDGVNP